MAGKTTAKPKVKKEEPEISMADIDDIFFRMGKAEEEIGGAIQAIDDMGLKQTALASRVSKVEARLGIG